MIRNALILCRTNICHLVTLVARYARKKLEQVVNWAIDKIVTYLCRYYEKNLGVSL